jgi:hypothetical protein
MSGGGRNIDMERITVVPQGREQLAFSFEMPAGWVPVAIPAEAPDFTDPKFFQPVGVAAAQYGLAVFSVGVRPAYEDGSVREWLAWLCDADGITIENLREAELGEAVGFAFDGLQSDGQTTMQMRNVYVEDGGRLYAVCAMAAAQIFPALEPELAAMAASFRMVTTSGATVPLAPALAV